MIGLLGGNLTDALRAGLAISPSAFVRPPCGI